MRLKRLPELRQSIYTRLLVRFILLIIGPVVVISLLLYSNIQQEAESQGQEAVRQLSGQVEANIKSRIAYIEGIRTSLSTENSLTTFLSSRYHESIDFSLYTTTVISYVKGVIGFDDRKSTQIYMVNETIPEGYGIFYRLSRVAAQPTVAGFLANETQSGFFFSSDFTGVDSAFGAESGSLVYLGKIMNGGRLAALIKINLPESTLWSGQSNYRVTGSGSHRILDLTAAHIAAENSYPEQGTGQIGNTSYAAISTGPLPIKITLVSDFSDAGRPATLLNLLWLGAMALAMAFMIKVLLSFTRKVYRCLDQMKASLQGGFSTRLSVQGKDEIAQISNHINILLDRVKTLMQEAVAQEALSKQTQIYALQNQINPHFIYNTMELFSSQMELYGHYDESEAMSDFARMLRYNLDGSDRYSLLSQEIAHTKSYLNIQRIRYPDIVCSISIPKELYSCRVIRFLLQPFVENSIKHGLDRFNPKLKIYISAVKTGKNEILFTVYDNGLGIDRQALADINKRLQDPSRVYRENGSAVGIDNINRRLRLFFGDQYQLEVYSVKSQWTMFSFSMPILEEG